MIFQKDRNAHEARHGGETLRIEDWRYDSLRVRAYMDDNRCTCEWALTEKPQDTSCTIRISEEDFWTGDGSISQVPCAEIINGRIRATVNFAAGMSTG